MFWKWKKSVNLDNSWHTSFKGKWTKLTTWITITHVMYQLTIISSRVLIQRVRAAQLIRQFLTIYGTQLFFVMFTRTRHCILSWTTRNHTTLTLNVVFNHWLRLPSVHVLSLPLLRGVLHVLPMSFTLNICLLASPDAFRKTRLSLRQNNLNGLHRRYVITVE